MRGLRWGPCLERIPLLLLLLLVYAIAYSETQQTGTATITAPRGASISTDSGYIAVSSPQEAYDRALRLLRSTLSGPATTGSKSATESRQPHHRNPHQSSGSLFESVTKRLQRLMAWSPLHIVQRTLYQVKHILHSYTPFKVLLGDPHSASSSKVGGSLKRKKQKWEGSSLITTSQSFPVGRDPAEEQQARAYPGARREQIWPEWDGGDEVFFGPFVATSMDEASVQAKGVSKVEETLNALVGSKIRAVREKATTLAAGSVRRKRTSSERRLIGDRNRAEAIALLTWAAGWGDAGSIQDEASLLTASSRVNWSEAAAVGPLTGSFSASSYISNFLASPSGALLAQNISRPHADALWVLGMHSLWGTHGTSPKPARAKACFERLASLNANASAHTKLAWLEGGAWGKDGWGMMGVLDPGISMDEEDRQAKALLHYTSAAHGGDISAQSALAYRYHAGIGVPQSCDAALYWYEQVAKDALTRFISGPPGGLTLPYTHLRLSDISGGVYGPGSSAASTGLAKHRPAIQAALHSLPSDGSSDGRRLEDLLEFFTYHADRGSPTFALRLAKVYYGGSVLGPSESAARVQRDYQKATQYLLKITQEVWPTDSAHVRRGGPTGSVAKQGQRGEDIKVQVDDVTAVSAGVAAGMIGKMWLRGEGVIQNYRRAWVWFSRGRDQSDPESFNGLGIMYRDGLGIPRDMKKAAELFEAAAAAHSVGGCINLAKMHLEMKDLSNAAKWFDVAMKLGDTFESYYYLALINLKSAGFAKDPTKPGAYKVGPPGTPSYERCRNAVSGFKYAAERADWRDGTFSRAERAWSKGLKAKALLGWTLAGEQGFEAAQNNVAWALDRDKKRLRVNVIDAAENNATDRLALIHWIRSAAQDNVDALVKMGDYYFHGLGLPKQTEADHWHTSPTSTASRAAPPAATASYEKAAACYFSAAEKQTSALAYWNMGFLYEKGLGVPKKDYNLAKRYYDMALELNPQEAYLPVFLSLVKLVVMAMWDAFAHKDASAVSLLNSLAFGASTRQGNLLGNVNTAGPYTEAEEIRMQKEALEMELDDELQGGDDLFDDSGQQQQQYLDDQLADPNLPETYVRKKPASNSQGGNEGDGQESVDDTIEGLMIVIGVAALAWLVYARQGVQMRLDRLRRENQGGGGGQDGTTGGVDEQQQQQHPGPPVVDPNQPFGWPLQDGNAYAGL